LHSDVEPSREGVDVNAADHRAELSDAVLFGRAVAGQFLVDAARGVR
jgi:hypothetical protein